MELTIIKENKISKFQIEGEMTVYDVCNFKEELLSAFEDTEEIELDLSKTISCDTASLQVLVSAGKAAKHKKIKFRLINPQEQFIQSLRIIGCEWENLNVN